MNTCDTCKWWGRSEWAKDRKGDDMQDFCENSKLDTHESEDGAYIYNSIDSGFKTGPKFGCIHWEQK